MNVSSPQFRNRRDQHKNQRAKMRNEARRRENLEPEAERIRATLKRRSLEYIQQLSAEDQIFARKNPTLFTSKELDGLATRSNGKKAKTEQALIGGDEMETWRD